MNLYFFKAFLPPGSGFASVHADPDPGGLIKNYFKKKLKIDQKEEFTNYLSFSL